MCCPIIFKKEGVKISCKISKYNICPWFLECNNEYLHGKHVWTSYLSLHSNCQRVSVWALWGRYFLHVPVRLQHKLFGHGLIVGVSQAEAAVTTFSTSLHRTISRHRKSAVLSCLNLENRAEKCGEVKSAGKKRCTVLMVWFIPFGHHWSPESVLAVGFSPVFPLPAGGYCYCPTHKPWQRHFPCRRWLHRRCRSTGSRRPSCKSVKIRWRNCKLGSCQMHRLLMGSLVLYLAAQLSLASSNRLKAAWERRHSPSASFFSTWVLTESPR